MKGDQKKAATTRHSLPNTAPANKRIPQPPTTPAATNKRSSRHSTTSTPSLDTRQRKTPRTEHLTRPTAKQDEQKEAEGEDTVEAAFTDLCSVVATSLATMPPQRSTSSRAALMKQYQTILASLHRLSPPATLSSLHPPPADMLLAVRSAATQLIAVARSLQADTASSSLIQSHLLQLQSSSLPLSASTTFALLLSATTALCQLLCHGGSAAHHSSHISADAVNAADALGGRYVERVTGVFGAELDALRKEGESSVGAACLPLLAQSMQHIIMAHLPNTSADAGHTLLAADLQQRSATEQVK